MKVPRVCDVAFNCNTKYINHLNNIMISPDIEVTKIWRIYWTFNEISLCFFLSSCCWCSIRSEFNFTTLLEELETATVTATVTARELAKTVFFATFVSAQWIYDSDLIACATWITLIRHFIIFITLFLLLRFSFFRTILFQSYWCCCCCYYCSFVC